MVLSRTGIRGFLILDLFYRKKSSQDGYIWASDALIWAGNAPKSTVFMLFECVFLVQNVQIPMSECTDSHVQILYRKKARIVQIFYTSTSLSEISLG